MNKWICAVAAALVCLAASLPARAAEDPFAVFDDIDAMMEDNALMEASNKYASVLLTFFPERATLIGYESANGKLDMRSPARDKAALLALQSLRASLSDIEPGNLSPAKRADFNTLQARIDYDIWLLSQNRLELDPLYYTQAYDSVYDLMLKRLSSAYRQNEDLAARSAALSVTEREAAQNLTQPSAFLAQLAMEKAYYAYLAYDEVVRRLQTTAEDEVTQQEVASTANRTRKSLKNMFESFKKLSQAQNTPDFRLGEQPYQFVLTNKYFITDSPSSLRKTTQRHLQDARKALQAALEPFTVDAEEETEVVTVEDLNAEPAAQPARQKKPAKKNKKKDKNRALPTAADFYAVRNRLALDVNAQNLISSVQQDAKELAARLMQDGTLTKLTAAFSVKEMPAYFAYMQPYLFVPPYGTQTNPTNDFFLRLPSGNALNKRHMLEKDFNAPTRKLMIAGELVPGRYYKSLYSENLSPIRKRYPVPTLSNGWSVYAQHLAAEKGYIVSDAELLFLAWEDYRRAAAAAVDLNLHLRQFSYADAMTFLTQANGFEQEEAEQIIKTAAARPGEAVSYLAGYDALVTQREKYEKRLRNRFSLSDFNARVLDIGDVAPATLASELAESYKNKKK